MCKAESSQPIRYYIIRLMGLLVAPLIFVCIVFGIGLLVINTVVGDISGYTSLLLIDPVSPAQEATDFLSTAAPGTANTGTVDIQDITFPKYEQVYGELSIPSINLVCPFLYGDTDEALEKGVCQYIGSTIVGYGGTTLACAHVNRHLKYLYKTKIGDQIQIRTTYGVYTYKIVYKGVHSANDESAYDLSREDENLVLYTCYFEQTSLGSVKMRYFVRANYVSGPLIVDRGNS